MTLCYKALIFDLINLCEPVHERYWVVVETTSFPYLKKIIQTVMMDILLSPVHSDPETSINSLIPSGGQRVSKFVFFPSISENIKSH